ncbi:MAG: D-alanyl-D-alanine carboxypeptidase/D-alanyl-D-alanine-endopeptidase [Gammaproteobacteria bacterium]|nr:D-alanyl-D-alanine carboxypeptidase/D-alanyl-D-alanine-endopeptidase [Gammaproteobacteria bacterium]
MSIEADQSKWQAILTQNSPDLLTSFHVIRLADNHVLAEQEPNRTLIPASLSKLVTAAAALKKLTPAHRFVTSFYHTGARNGKRIKGDFVVVGGGDPLFTSEKLWQLAVDLRHLGLSEITGDLIVDNHLFGEVFYDESRRASFESSYAAYDAPLSAFAVNFNTVSLAIIPQLDKNKPTLELDPYPLPFIHLGNHLMWAGPSEDFSVEAFRATRPTHAYVIANGKIPKGLPFQKLYRSVGDPVRLSGELLKVFLQKEGIQIKGNVKAGSISSDAKLLCEVLSEPLSQIILKMNHTSNNFIADMLVSALGASRQASQAADLTTLQRGTQVLSSFLQDEVGIRDPFVLKNGSGLHVDNHLSTKQLTTLLKYMSEDMTLFPEFWVSLPVFGISGTLADRLRDHPALSPLKGIVRAKTGTLTEPVMVSGLAGYLQHPKEGLLAFAIIQNGVPEQQPVSSIVQLHQQQDELLIALLGWK